MTSEMAGQEIQFNDAAQGSSLPPRLKLFRFLGRQTWIPRGQDRLLRAVWNPRAERTFSFEVDFFGLRYRGNLSQLLDWNVFGYGAYALRELTLLAAIAEQLRKRKGHVAFFDIGANLGHHALFMSQYADEVVAFEPFPSLQESIQQKIRINHLTNVRLVPVALGLEDATRSYFPGDGANSGAGTFIPEIFDSYLPPVQIEIRNGDRLHQELGLPPVDLLKADVEGFESLLFGGLRACILRDRPPILLEMGDRVRAGFGREDAFKNSFYPGAVFAEVTGRNGRPYILKQFRYESSHEALVAPPELASWVDDQIHA